MIDEPLTWQDMIKGIDELIEQYKQRLHTNPEFYEQRIAIKMRKRQLAVKALVKTQELRDIVDEYLEDEEEML